MTSASRNNVTSLEPSNSIASDSTECKTRPLSRMRALCIVTEINLPAQGRGRRQQGGVCLRSELSARSGTRITDGHAELMSGRKSRHRIVNNSRHAEFDNRRTETPWNPLTDCRHRCPTAAVIAGRTKHSITKAIAANSLSPTTATAARWRSPEAAGKRSSMIET